MRLGVVAHAYNSRTLEVKAEGSGQGHPWIHSKFETSLGYTIPYL